MPTAWDAAARQSLIARARTLTPQHTAAWGKFTVAGMLSHLNDAMRMATGALPIGKTGPALLRFPPLRYLVIHHLPMPKNAPTAPELLTGASSSDFTRELDTFCDGFAKLDGASHRLVPHPIFGELSHADWGALIHKHTDHHLRQFGV